MRASAFKETGGPEVLRLVELPDPEPGPGEVLNRVAHAGVNYGEIQHRLGDFGEPDGETVTGLEASGRVTALGEGVTGVSVGDAVTHTSRTAAATRSTRSPRPPSPSRSPTASTCGRPAAPRSS